MKLVRFALFFAILTGCVPQAAVPTASTPQSMILVREFRTVSATRVVIDTSFGFSLHRGEPGVPLRERALSVSRGVAFNIADTITEKLKAAGYNAVHVEAGNPAPAGKAIIVVGTLRTVDEGHRRRVGAENAGVAADVEIDYWAPGMHPLAALQVDSRQLADDGGETHGAAAVNLAAARLGREIAKTVIAAAHKVDLPGAGR